MKKISLIFISLILLLSCENKQNSSLNSENANSLLQTQITAENPVSDRIDEIQNSDTEAANETYPGVTIDQKFSFIESHSFQEKDFKEKTFSVNAEDFQVTIKNFAPKTISKNGKIIFSYKTLYPNEYSSSLVGVSHLLSENSKEIYVVATGPGGVCCTNYWITDVSGEEPKNIFRSEDFGGFRDPMEIFDADGDGIYELMQWDSAFRYFMGDCGSCSPEPRAIFKYDEKLGKYLPAKGIQQDFVKESFLKTEKWLTETSKKLKEAQDPGLKLDFHRSLLSHIVDLLYLGEESKAWKTFDEYYSNDFDKEKTRTEIKKRLRQSKFYQQLIKNG